MHFSVSSKVVVTLVVLVNVLTCSRVLNTCSSRLSNQKCRVDRLVQFRWRLVQLMPCRMVLLCRVLKLILSRQKTEFGQF
jgi:hypothetical protein